MAKLDFDIHIDLLKNELLNARLQNLSTHPSVTANDVGFVYWNISDEDLYIYTGTQWISLGSLYVHPTFPGSSQPSSPLTGATVISGITLNNGHVTGVTTRNLTPADIGAATAVHTHAFSQITGLPTNTILGNNTGGTATAKALTVGEVLTLLGIAFGSLSILNTGTDIVQRTWTAKDINDWLTNKLSTYLTVVNLALGTRTGTTMPITNSAGTGVTLPIATTTLAGLMSAADKVKLNGIAAGANNYVHPTNNPGVHPFATLITSGLQVLSQMIVNNEGHVTSISGRNLTAADIASVMINDAINNGTFQTWSSTKIYTEIQAAISQAQSGALIYQGSYNPVTNTPNVTTNTGVKVGWTYVISANGTFAGQEVEIGDMIIAKVDNPGSTASNWQVVNKNIPAIVSATTTIEGIIFLATTAEALAGNNATKAITPATLKAVLDSKIGGYVAVFGNGSATSFTITHGLNSSKVHAEVYRVSDQRRIMVDIATTSSTQVVINTNSTPANGAYEARIWKIV